MKSLHGAHSIRPELLGTISSSSSRDELTSSSSHSPSRVSSHPPSQVSQVSPHSQVSAAHSPSRRSPDQSPSLQKQSQQSQISSRGNCLVASDNGNCDVPAEINASPPSTLNSSSPFKNVQQDDANEMKVSQNDSTGSPLFLKVSGASASTCSIDLGCDLHVVVDDSQCHVKRLDRAVTISSGYYDSPFEESRGSHIVNQDYCSTTSEDHDQQSQLPIATFQVPAGQKRSIPEHGHLDQFNTAPDHPSFPQSKSPHDQHVQDDPLVDQIQSLITANSQGFALQLCNVIERYVKEKVDLEVEKLRDSSRKCNMILIDGWDGLPSSPESLQNEFTLPTTFF